MVTTKKKRARAVTRAEFEGMRSCIGALETRQDVHVKRIDALEDSKKVLDARITALDGRVTSLEERASQAEAGLIGAWARHDKANARITALENAAKPAAPAPTECANHLSNSRGDSGHNIRLLAGCLEHLYAPGELERLGEELRGVGKRMAQGLDKGWGGVQAQTVVTPAPPPPAPLPWAAPQPIETAPPGKVMTICAGDDPEWMLEELENEAGRATAKKWGRTHWMAPPPPPDDPAWEEARLMRAVVDAAMADWAEHYPRNHCKPLMDAVVALRAHRAKKGK